MTAPAVWPAGEQTPLWKALIEDRERPEEHLDEIIAQMKEAIRNKFYLVLDYHSDLYSRHTFTQDSKNTGNGAPGWIVNGGNHGTDSCGLPCDISWSAHKLSDPAVRSAIRSFWLNDDVSTYRSGKCDRHHCAIRVGVS